MSSLMQSPGRVLKGKVEIFLTLKHSVETPMRCMWCAHPYVDGMVCKGCKRAITHLFKYYDPCVPGYCKRPAGRSDETTEVAEQWDDDTRAVACGRPGGTVYCSNSWNDDDSELDLLTRPSGTTTYQPRLYRIWRKPIDMLGCWVRFRWCNRLHAPDLSTPTRVYQHEFPKDAKPLTIEEAQAYWF